ncbi:MAG: ABC transporter permease [Acidobacteriota bacterium]
MLKNLATLLRYRVLLQTLVSRELKGRYRGSFFGFLWSFFNPLLLMVVYSLVFSYILKQRDPETTPYALFLFCGLLPWTWFSSSILEASNSLMVNAGLIKKILFPAEVLPLVNILANLVHFLLGLPILLIFVLYYQHHLTVYFLCLPIVLLVQLIFTAGLGFLVAALSVHFRDLQNILANLLTLWFFATPIIYPMTFPGVRESTTFKTVLNLNPVTHLMEGYQSTIFYGRMFDVRALGITLLVSLALFLLGYYVFDALRDSYPEEV